MMSVMRPEAIPGFDRPWTMHEATSVTVRKHTKMICSLSEENSTWQDVTIQCTDSAKIHIGARAQSKSETLLRFARVIMHVAAFTEYCT
jgi:hypothetical protein